MVDKKEIKKETPSVENTSDKQVKVEPAKEVMQEPTFDDQEIGRLFVLYLDREPDENELRRFNGMKESEGNILTDYLNQIKEQEKVTGEEDNLMTQKNETARPLGDGEISSLFGEYGLPLQNIEEVRRTMPNDEEKLRAVLDTKRDLATKEMKTRGDMDIANLKTGMAPMSMTPAAAAGGGMGGPGTIEQQYPGSTGSTWHQDGNIMLVKFSSDPTPNDDSNEATIWLFNKPDKTYRPFRSEEAIKNFFGEENYEEALGRVQSLNPAVIGSDPNWEGQFLKRRHGIFNDGSVLEDEQEEFTRSINSAANDTYNDDYGNNDIKTGLGEREIYGEIKDPQAELDNAVGWDLMYGAMRMAKDDISKETLEKYANDNEWESKVVNAMTYGGYNAIDIYKDLKAKDLAQKGNEQYKEFKGFDESMKANVWKTTEEGQSSISDPALECDYDLYQGISPGLFDYPIFKISNVLYSVMNKPLEIDWDDPRMTEEVEQIEASIYDIQKQMAEAETSQAQAVAKNTWDTYRETLQEKYRVQLSNNVREAWGQLENMFSSASTRGLKGSGIMSEVMDKYLRDVRASNGILRETEQEEQDMEKRNYLLQYGTPEEVQAFIDEDPLNSNKAIEWGLRPSNEIAQSLSYAALKETYPELSDEEIAVVRGSILDENGMYKSGLSQTLYTRKEKINEEKLGYQQFQLWKQGLDDERVAYQEFDPSNPNSWYQRFLRGEITLEDINNARGRDAINKGEEGAGNVEEVIGTENNGNIITEPNFREGLNQVQKNSITNLLKKPKEQWSEIDKENYNYAVSPVSTTQTSANMPGMPEATPNFKEGLNQAQKDSITTLLQKPKEQWSEIDKKNYNYAIPSSTPPPATQTPINMPGMTSPVTPTQQPEELNKIAQEKAAEAAGSMDQTQSPQYTNYMSETKEGTRIFNPTRAENEAEAKKKKLNITGWKGWADNKWTSI